MRIILAYLVRVAKAKTNELDELRRDRERLDAMDEGKWQVYFNDRIQAFIVQDFNQVVGSIGHGFTFRAAIDSAMKEAARVPANPRN